MKIIKFTITNPLNLANCFNVLEDQSAWFKKEKYMRLGGNIVPNRNFALKFSELLIPKKKTHESFFSKNSKYNYGIYILLFNDFKKYYVGIAAKYSKFDKNRNLVKIKNPEGIFTRLRKHRAKCTGTYCNINHTKFWRQFALERYEFYEKKNKKDIMSDCELSFIFFNNHEKYKINDKGILEEFEDHINQHNISNILNDKYSNFYPIATTKSRVLSYVPTLSKVDLNTLL